MLLLISAALALHGELVAIVPALVGGLLARDAVAWLRLPAGRRAEFVAHVESLRRPLPSTRLPLVAAVPFLVSGSLSAAALVQGGNVLALVGLIGSGVLALALLVDWLRLHITH